MVAVSDPPRRAAGPGAAPPPRSPRTPPGTRTLLAAAALVVAASAGGIAVAPGYAAPAAVYAVLPACALAAVAATLLLRGRLSGPAALLAGLPLPLAAVAVCAHLLPGEGAGVLGGAAEAVLHSGARILTSAAPTPLSVDTLALPMLATWLTGAAQALAHRSGRTGLALLPGLLLLVGAVVLNGPVAPPGFPAIGMLAAAAALLMAVSTPEEAPGAAFEADRGPSPALTVRVEPGVHRSGSAALRRALVTGLATVLAAAATVVGGPVLLAGWDARPGDPRAALSPPVSPQAALNPLGYLAGWAAHPDEPLLTVSAPEPVDLRWVALGDFTGTTWLPEGGYRAAGRVLPEPVPPPPHARRVTAEITVDPNLPGTWVPVVGAPRRVDLPSLGYAPVSGTVVRMEGPLDESTYRTAGDVARWRPAELAEASTPAGEVFDRYRELPAGAPPILNDIVGSVAAEGSPYDRARALARYLRESHSFDPRTPGGHGYANVAAILAEPGRKGGGGTSEQFASAFAMLARAAGLPSRVAVGFGPGTDEGGGRYRVRTGDAVAWGEVYFDGIGWVPFAVTPGGEDSEDTGGAPESAPEPEEADAAQDGADASEDADPHDVAAPPSRSSGTWWRPAGAAAAGAFALVLAVPVLRLARTRRRLGGGTAEARVLGAWQELGDTLRMCRAAPPPGNTATDTAALARGLLPEGARARAQPDLDRLAAAVNSVSFGASAAGAGIDAAAANRVAGGARPHLRALRASRGRGRRLTWWLDPRPLFWRNR
ncbi:transglutaminase-like domain-containing protein [Streptomonospora arabica]|uniref:Transglutaminase-like domain-containing protein n=1 Tax=Streptomonospora arabica TaxID=412417 RepID=A0ABV9SP95_9ACTN